MKDILFIAAHPDDETLGCGGTILRNRSDGDATHWLIVTNMDERYGWEKSVISARQDEIEKVSKSYGFKSVTKLDYPTVRLDTLPLSDITASISKVMADIEPSVVYIPNRSDIHTDHQIVFQASISCMKNFRAPFIKKILMYETLSETEFAPPLPGNVFSPNLFVDISDQIEKKIEIMKIYSSEVMDAPFPRSPEAIRAQAASRGSRIGREYAEAFVILEEII
ncbi:MAG: PIG-L family deacetylase [Candidatus Krumholzibacteriota bacterium]|nr:PIG-L family deacetylase [Candidatus Krumholzibacteriota bacterium]